MTCQYKRMAVFCKTAIQCNQKLIMNHNKNNKKMLQNILLFKKFVYLCWD